ncbi:hypothetical protein [Kitasatospora sp. NPDC005748]|uniref:hypothetical protein n=1 Tax=Kitasatospora sp. NPDC005748 TaxID=3157063 RepID=UPI0034075B4E
MHLEFVGIDPETEDKGSPTVWVDRTSDEIVVQGWRADTALLDAIGGTEWVPGHETGIPDPENVVRIPARMIPILRKACDDAERR